VNSGKAKRKPLHRRIMPAIFRRLKPVGITIEPFLTVREGERPIEINQDHEKFDVSFLQVKGVEELIRLEPKVSQDMLVDWFREGKLCFAVRDGSTLIAKMWCDLEKISYMPNYRKLADDEVYLFAAYAHPDYRGQNLAPLMRSACYAALRNMGRSRFYGYTDYENTAARRFKEKLGAREEALRLHLDLFGIWSKTVTLRQYN